MRKEEVKVEIFLPLCFYLPLWWSIFYFTLWENENENFTRCFVHLKGYVSRCEISRWSHVSCIERVEVHLWCSVERSRRHKFIAAADNLLSNKPAVSHDSRLSSRKNSTAADAAVQLSPAHVPSTKVVKNESRFLLWKWPLQYSDSRFFPTPFPTLSVILYPFSLRKSLFF